MNKSLPRQHKLKLFSVVYINKAICDINYVNLESNIEVLGHVAQQCVTCYSSINYS